jgi:hypothetical protein
MNFDNLNSENILLFAMKAYDRPNMIISEFKDDMKRFNYLKRLFKRHRNYKDVKEQLILNHLIVLYNVFGPEVATRLLFYKMSKEDYSALKTYLIFINCMPEVVRGIKGSDIMSSEIEVDSDIAHGLRKIK